MMKILRFLVLGTVACSTSVFASACSSDDTNGNGATNSPDAGPGSGDGGGSDSGSGDSGGPHDGGAADVGFNVPTKSLKANSASSEIGDADLSCLGTPSGDLALTASATLTSSVLEYQTATIIDSSTVTAFANIDVAAPFATGLSGSNGSVSLTFPPATKRFGLKLTDTVDGYLDTLFLNQILDPAGGAQTKPLVIPMLSTGTAATFASQVGTTSTTGAGIVLGTFQDCAGHEVSSFVVTVSSTEGTATPLAGADAYYFTADIMSVGAKHSDAEAATANGRFVIFGVPVAATAYVQMWGFKNASDLASNTLALVGELQIPVIADTAVTGTFEPLRTP